MAITPDLIRAAARARVSDETMTQLLELYVAQQRRRLERRCPLADIADGLVDAFSTVFGWCRWLLSRVRRRTDP